MPKSPTLNRFPLFAFSPIRPLGTWAIPKTMPACLATPRPCSTPSSRPRPRLEGREEPTKKKELPTEIEAKTKTLQFGGQEFQVIYGKGKRLKQTVVGHEVHDAEEYDQPNQGEVPRRLVRPSCQGIRQVPRCPRSRAVGQGTPLRSLQSVAGREQGWLQSRRSGKVGGVA